MRSISLTKLPFVLLFLCLAAYCQPPGQKINPRTQIRWPIFCNSPSQVYIPQTNQCADINAIDPNSQLSWPSNCNAPGMVYNKQTNLCINMNAINPGNQVLWPGSCTGPTQVYSPSTNTCIVNGTANNPAGNNTELQFNQAGNFGSSSNVTYDAPNNGLKIAGKITVGGSSPVNTVTVGPQSTVPASWNFDLTTPAVTLNSIAPGVTAPGSGALGATTFLPGTLTQKDNSATVSVTTPPYPPTNVTRVRWDSCWFNVYATDPTCGTTNAIAGPFMRLLIANPTRTVNNDTYQAGQFHLDAVTGGINQSTPSVQKSNWTSLWTTMLSFTPGQHFTLGQNMFNASNGDTFGIASYNFQWGNTNAAGDEGQKGIAAYTQQGKTEFTAIVNVGGVVGNVLNYNTPSSGESYSRGEQRIVINETSGVVTSPGTIASISGQPPVVVGTGTTFTALGTGAVNHLCFSLDGANSANGGGTSWLYVIQIATITDDTHMTLNYTGANGAGLWAGDVSTGAYHIFKCAMVTAVAKSGAITVDDGTQFAGNDHLRMVVGNTLQSIGVAIQIGHWVPGGLNTGLFISNSGSSPLVARQADNAIQFAGPYTVMLKGGTGANASRAWIQDLSPVNSVVILNGQLATSNVALLTLNRASGIYQEFYDNNFDARKWIGAQTYRFQGYDATHARFDVDTSGGIPILYVDAGTTPGGVFVNNGSKMNFNSGNQSTITAVIDASAGTMQTKKSYTVATLPTCNAAAQGTFTFVTDGSASPAYLATIASGGSTITPVFCDGTNWKAH